MGRAKVNMEPINNVKKRKFTFKKRKDGLMKKAFELTTLCDVNVSMIIYSDDQEPQIFPQDPHKFNSMIDLYKRYQNTDPGKIRYYSLSDFFNDRKIKIDQELAKARKKNMEAKYPTWFEFLNDFSEVQLREFACGLERKINIAKSKIESPKINPQIQNVDHHANFYPTGTLLDVHSSFVTPSINPSPLPMTMPMNYNDLEFDPAPLFTDQINLAWQPSDPNYSELLKFLMSENDDCYDNENFSLQPQIPGIPMNHNDFVFADQNNVIIQSKSPNLGTLKLLTSENNDCYDYENFSLQPQSPTFCLQAEIPELPPFMHMNPVSTSESSSQMTYNAGANRNDYHYIV